MKNQCQSVDSLRNSQTRYGSKLKTFLIPQQSNSTRIMQNRSIDRLPELQ